MKLVFVFFFAVVLAQFALGQNQSAALAGPREWSNTEGRKIIAQYLGVQKESVVVKLADGKVLPIPIFKLSEADKAFVRDNPLVYLEVWKGWPVDLGKLMNVTVTEKGMEKDKYVYETANFRFHVDGNLGATLMKDLAQVFELTYSLHMKAPFGLKAKPRGDRFEAKFFGTRDRYQTQGGLPRTAGVYLTKDRVFLAPLDLMGVKVDGSIWRQVRRSQGDTSTVVHELTHMLTHDIIADLPIWMNEGYAEYIANIPIEQDAFQISDEKIREGVRESFVLDYQKAISSTGIRDLSRSERSQFFEQKLPSIPPVSTVLGITNERWNKAQDGSLGFPGQTYGYSDRGSLYKTSHLIIYYFLHLDGEEGASKLCRFASHKRKVSEDLDAYRAAFEEYQRKFEEFSKLPGVEKTPDGRIRYPSDLNPPEAPKSPFGDGDAIQSSGFEILLGGEKPEVLAQKIEAALIKNLELPLKFDKQIRFEELIKYPPGPRKPFTQ